MMRNRELPHHVSKGQKIRCEGLKLMLVIQSFQKFYLVIQKDKLSRFVVHSLNRRVRHVGVRFP